MKKIYFFLTMLVTLCLAGTMQAQSTLTVHDGEATSQYIPFDGYNADHAQHNQMIYPASDLSAMNGMEITQMVFYFNGSYGSYSSEVETGRLGTWTVSLGETTASTLTELNTSTTLSQVYQGIMTWDHTALTLTITFENGYVYNGGNLLIDFVHTAASWNRYYFIGEGTSNNVSFNNYNSSAYNFLPKLTFSYNTPPSCSKPTNVALSFVNNQMAYFTWDDIEGASWQIANVAAGETPTYWGSTITNHEAGTTGLTASTQYDFYVRRYCSATDQSEPVKVSYWTKCNPITSLPWNEDFENFEGTGGVSLSDPCWENKHLEGSGTYLFQVFSGSGSTNAVDGNSTNMLRLPDMSSGTMTKLVLPCMTLPTDQNYQFVLDIYRGTNTPSYVGEGIRVYASTDGEIDGATELAFISRNYTVSDNGLIPAEETAGWYTYELPIPFTGNCYIILRGESKYGWATFMDNFKVEELPSCTKPTALHVVSGSLTAHTVTIEWDADEDAMFQALMPAGTFDPNEPPTNWNVQAQTENTANWNSLTPDRDYGVWVRKWCSATEQSEPVYITFHTPVACLIPTGLTATLTSGDGSVADLSWTETGEATNWILEYSTADDFTGATSVNVSGTPAQHITGLTAETTYYARVKADCGSEDGQSGWSSTISFTPTNAYILTVNDGGSTNQYIPVYGFYCDNYSRSQFIIPAANLTAMEYGHVNKITFYASQSNVSWGDAQFKVYMSETEATILSELSDWDELEEVYTGSLSISGNQMVITLDNPYQYLGGNLLIGVNQTVTGTYSSCTWYGVAAPEGASMGGYGDAININKQNFLPKTTFEYTPGTAPTCIKPTGLEVNYTGGNTAQVSWTSDASAFNIEVNGTVTNNVTNPYTLSELTLATVYEVKVQADCGSDGTSDWTNPVSFTTDLCEPADQCEITLELTDNYGDGWNGNAIKVVDVESGLVLGEFANTSAADPLEAQTYYLAVCNGHEIQFQWVAGNEANETSYAVLGPDGNTIFSGSNSMANPVNYTVDCEIPVSVCEFWELVTDNSLEVGDQIVIASLEQNVAMSTTQGNNNRGVEIVTKNTDNTLGLPLDEAIQILTLEEGTSTGTYALYTGDGYLYAAGGSNNNYLKTESSLDNNGNGNWAISVSSDGTASIVAQGTATRNVMQYNQNSSIISCYGSANQSPLAIYKLTNLKSYSDTTATVVGTEFAWHGKTYYESGVYGDTLIGAAANGCDSVVLLHLTLQTPPHTVTFEPGTGTCAITELTESVSGAGVTLPEAIACTNTASYVFAGWSDANIVVATSTAPVLYNAGDVYNPSENTTLYAVYKAETTGEGTPTWTKTTSIAADDQVIIVCESASKELGNMSSTSSIGPDVSYTGEPQGAYLLTVTAGSATGTYSFVDENGNYLYWNSGNELRLNTSKTAKSSWNVTFDSGDNAIILNAGDNNRKLQYNSGNPRFACYTSDQTAVQLYKLTPTSIITYLYFSTPECGELTYNVTVSTDITNGTVTADPTTAAESTLITLTATPATGYHFGQWNVVDDDNNPVTVTENTFVMPASDVTVNAIFWIDTLNITATVNPNNAGTVEGTGEFEYGSSTTLSATPAEGYLFSSWTLDGTEVGTTATLTVNPITEDAAYVANFVVMGQVAAPTFTPAAGEYDSENIPEITINCATEGATIHYTTDGSEPTATSAVYSTPINITGTTTIKAIAMKDEMLPSEVAEATYTINQMYYVNVATDIANGEVTADPVKGLVNAEITLTATPATGYHFGQWNVVDADNEPVEVSNNTFNMPASDVTVSAIFLPDTFNLILEAMQGTLLNGYVRDSHYIFGEGFTLPTADDVEYEGHTFGGWYSNYDFEGDPMTEISTDAYGDTTVFAKWTVNIYTISASVNPTNGGSVEGTGQYEYGSDATLVATPAEGFLFNSWTLDGEVVSTNPVYDIIFIEGDAAYVANFEAMGTVATPVINPNGGTFDSENIPEITISCATEGATIYYTTDGSEPTPNSQQYGDEPITITGTTTIKVIAVAENMLPSEVTTVTFTINQVYYVTVEQDENGVIVAEPLSGIEGSIITLSATPEEGYFLKAWNVLDGDNEPVEVTNDAFNMPASDVTVSAVFLPDTFTVTVVASPTAGGTVISGAGRYAYGDEVDIQFEANPGYQIDYIGVALEGEDEQESDNVFSMPVGNVYVTLYFMPETYSLTLEVMQGTLLNGYERDNQYTFGEGFTLPTAADVEFEGHTFGGWYSNYNFEGDPMTSISTDAYGDTTVYAKWTPNDYTLTIHYQFTNGTQAAPDYSASVTYSAEYSVESPIVEGYTPDQTVVSGTMPAENVEVTVTYGNDFFPLTIHYLYPDNTPAHDDVVENYAFGSDYEVASPAIANYMPDQVVVTGTMGSSAVEVTVNYILVEMNAVDDIIICNGGFVPAIAFSSSMNIGEMSYEWTSDTQLPINNGADAGEGDIESFQAIITGNEPLVATITVTPTCTYQGMVVTGVPQVFTITVNPSLTSEFSITACDEYSWTEAHMNIRVEGTHDYVYHFETAEGCDSIVTLHLTLYKSPADVVADITDNTSCAADQPNGVITVTAPAGEGYEFALNDGEWQSAAEFTGLAAGTYNVSARTVGSECVKTIAVVVSDNVVMPVVTASTDNTFYCVNGTITLTGEVDPASEDYEYAWTGPNNYSATILNPNPMTATGAEQSGTYTLAVTNSATNCTVETTVEVVVNEPNTPGYEFTISTHGDAYANINEGETEATVVLADPEVHHFLSDCNWTVSNDAAATYNAVGDYTITWTATDDCGNIATTTQTLHVTQNTCGTPIDGDNNSYPTVTLNGTCWMAANLRTTRYSDGRAVPVYYQYQSATAPNVTENVDTYGLLYDWYSAMDVERPTRGTMVQGVCPAGWRMPNEDDFNAIENIDLYTLRSTDHWLINNADNSTGFNLLPAGQYNADKDRYENLLGNAYFWSADATNESEAHCHMADCNCYMWYEYPSIKFYGYSVRCVKNE